MLSSIRACRVTDDISRWRWESDISSPAWVIDSATPQRTATGPRISWAVVAIARRRMPMSSDEESR